MQWSIMCRDDDTDSGNVGTLSPLHAQRIHTVVRRGGVRVSPHFYTDAAELDALLDAL